MKKAIAIISIIILLLIGAINNDIILKMFYKTDYSQYIEKYSLEYGADKFMIYAIIKAESNFNASATSNKGACGLMQLMDNTAREVANNETIEYTSNSTLFNAEKNIKIGIKYFTDLKKELKNDGLALAAYNAGIGNVNNWINNGIIKEDGSNLENIPFKETNIYVRKTLNNYKIYKKLYE